MSKKRISYYYDPEVGSYTYGLGHLMKPHRIRMAHELITAYGMLEKMSVLRAKRASAESMTAFHTDEYIHFLSRVTPETADELTYNGTRFLLGDDNPPFDGVFEYSSISAGGSLAAARRIQDGAADIAINWAGGLHHAKKREASGFCYINDIVLCILELLRTYARVLYIDVDCHHGDGVEEAFYTTDRVMTCSLHKFGEFFPGTGTLDDKGYGKGKGYSVNVPLKDGIRDDSYKSVFEPVIGKILEVFRPSAVVLQLGADSLAGDKLGCFNLTMHGHANCVTFLRNAGLPLVLLGGGGYTTKNVARAWTYETGVALNMEQELDDNLPWCSHFEWYGPRYKLEVQANNMDDINVKDGSLDRVRISALQQLSELGSRNAPSVGMHDVPRQSVGSHLGLGDYDVDVESDGDMDDLDRKLAQHARYVYRLQESDANQNSDESDEDSDTSYSSRRKRMSILTNRYFDASAERDPCGQNPSRRKFFKSRAHWDPTFGQVTVNDRSLFATDKSLSTTMENGGSTSGYADAMDEDQD
ncbi:histone deacetylase RPD3 [Coniophora puteana RWD-64-598 SS2]|uniref:Histone deacetylase n=1 Tax=Coniophora puteana (strain RWD-64-598) TaxID=741705 RepID=A0A5M3MSG7_CONPW|nr:histone deacetylase RPD3 [Coniophora puteana RWD-64-598 SS2]EIW82040.1 histone deacetylase RPD3 [Coniophora puteana RWD-64-598 SS2]